MEEMDETEMMKKKCPELKEMCRARKLPVSGTKNELIARLLGQPKPPKKPSSKSKPADVPERPALSLARERCPAVIITRNEEGQFEHKETGLIFDEKTKRVIGKRCNAEIESLKISDVELCRENGFLFDDARVDKEFSSRQTNRLEELTKYIDDDSDDEE